MFSVTHIGPLNEGIAFPQSGRNRNGYAARYYEAQSRNLGRRFLRHLQETVDSIVAFPYAGTAVRGDIRRRLVRQFPFAVFYSVAPEEILIIAVMDLRRDPEYWMNRV